MALRQLLRPTNRRIRYLVGCLLIGLFCIQCIPAGNSDRGNTLIARTQEARADETADRLLELAKSDHIALLKLCRDHYDGNVRGYTCTLIKQERINGELGEEQEIDVKFLNAPFSVAMKWTRNAPIGDRILYVEGNYDDMMIVRPKSGLLRVLTGGSVRRKPNGPDAMKNTLRPVSLFGFRRGLRELIKVYQDAREAGDLEASFGGHADVAGRRTLVLERLLPPRGDYPAWKTLIYVDTEYLVPVCIEAYNWEKQLSSRYLYKDIRFNVGLTSDDFLPEANGIQVGK